MNAWREGLAAKSWLVSILAFVAVAALTLPALNLSELTQSAARHIRFKVLGGITNAAEIDVLLERHRRLVESAPAEVDRVQLEKEEKWAITVEGQLTSLVHQADPALAIIIANLLPGLTEHRAKVFLFATNFAQDKATAAANDYGAIAEVIGASISRYRVHEARVLDGWAMDLKETADSFNSWLWISVLATVVILGPFSLTLIHTTVRKLIRLRHVMMRLAHNDTAIAVPFTSLRDEVGDIARAVTVFQSNAVALLEKEIRLTTVNHQFDIALNHMSHGLCMFDSEQRVVVCNRRYLDLYGLTCEQVMPGTTLRQILEYRIARGIYSAGSPENYVRERLASVTQASIAVHQLSDGRSFRISHQPMASGGWVTTHEDVTEQSIATKRIAHMASHDALTNLGNRSLLRDRLAEELPRVRRGATCALHYLDLDRFKSVNDTLGHPVGDALLKAVAERLRSSVREIDTVVRLGGDEFSVLQLGVENSQQAMSLACRLIEVISAPYQIAEHAITIGTSIGIALAPRDGIDSDDLIKKADIALYHAKETSRGSAAMFEPSMQAHSLARRAMEQDLREAIANEQFSLHYQPVVDLKSGGVSCFEALIRWNHPRRGAVSPMDFIPVAEEVGLISSIGEWVLRRACKDAIQWPAGIKIAVNVSPIQFKGTGLVALVTDALAQVGLDAGRLTLEVTESTLLEGDDAVLKTLNRLRELGVTIALDDFGTGYSSMSYLRRFPFDVLKIDRSFIRDAAERNDSAAIVRAIASLASSLGMKTVAEGVETTADLHMVREAGCSHVQGYLFSRPVPVTSVAAVLASCSAEIRAAAA